jgi:hypothetical protein
MKHRTIAKVKNEALPGHVNAGRGQCHEVHCNPDKYMRVSPLKFRLSLSLPGEDAASEVAPEIEHLGPKAVEFARALNCLSRAGNRHAKEMLQRLGTCARQYRAQSRTAALKSIESSAILPIHLHPAARWKMDHAGLFSLELLLWFVHLRQKPRDEIIGSVAVGLPPFDKETAAKWWKLARICLVDIYPHLDRVEKLAELVQARSCRRSSVACSNYIQRKIGERFRSFAPPAAPYRI